MIKFKNLGLGEDLIARLNSQGISTPTPIQEQSIGLIKNKQDVIAEAQTGTGKTLAFLLPMFENMSAKENRTQGLIITPTRELALQITQEARKINTKKRLNILAVYGGQDIRAQLNKLRTKVHLIIGTPGRIIDHIRRNTLNLKQLDTLVLDEADQMFHIGFKKDIEFIISNTPKEKQMLCFSATMNKDVNKLAYKHMKEPTVIAVKKKEVTLENIKQRLIMTSDRNKQRDLFKLINKENPFMAIIFCRTRRRVDKLEETLLSAGHNCKKLHGGMTQSQRESVMKRFKATKIQYLIATDVAARGLDVSGVTHVINYDIPDNTESYIHRMGRTGRAGNIGSTYLFVASRDRTVLRQIESTIKMKIPVESLGDIDNQNTQNKEENHSKQVTPFENNRKKPYSSKFSSKSKSGNQTKNKYKVNGKKATSSKTNKFSSNKKNNYKGSESGSKKSWGYGKQSFNDNANTN